VSFAFAPRPRPFGSHAVKRCHLAHALLSPLFGCQEQLIDPVAEQLAADMGPHLLRPPALFHGKRQSGPTRVSCIPTPTGLC
jgi:hypothetical protein